MKRISPTRGKSLTLVIGAAVVLAGVAAGQQRHGDRSYSSGPYRGGSAPSYHPGPSSSYHQQAPAYRQPMRQQGYGAMPQDGYRAMPQQGYRAMPEQAPQGYRGYSGGSPSGQQAYYARPQGVSGERHGQEQAPAPVERRQPNQPQYQGRQPNQPDQQGQPYSGQQGYQSRMPQAGPAQRPQNQVGPRGEHLEDWMNQHRNLTPQQQQQALQHEPGFNQLPQQTQNRMRSWLTQLNAMPPERRERILNYNERMEHLSLGQRKEVRNSLQQLGGLPEDQRREVARSFRELRALPPDQRGAELNSPQYQYMNPAERSTLNNLLRVEPLLPPSEEQPR